MLLPILAAAILIGVFGCKTQDYWLAGLAALITATFFAFWLRRRLRLREILLEAPIADGRPVQMRKILPQGGICFALVSGHGILEYPSIVDIVITGSDGRKISWPGIRRSIFSTRKDTVLDTFRIISVNLPSEQEYLIFVSLDGVAESDKIYDLYVFVER